MRFKKIIKLFKNNSVCVVGMKGKGKDTLIGNVINRRKQLYISNMDYSKGKERIPLKLSDLDIKNDYTNFINDNINKYVSPFPKGADIYISDCGIYFPSQYCSQLNNQFKTLPGYFALSRQLAQHNVHFNAQNLNRVWDKIREHSDIYISCQWCLWLFKKIVIQKIIIYDKVQSCIDRVKPCRVNVPLFNKNARVQARIYKDQFYNTHGMVKSKFLIYWNKSKHDTYLFDKVLRYVKE